MLRDKNGIIAFDHSGETIGIEAIRALGKPVRTYTYGPRMASTHEVCVYADGSAVMFTLGLSTGVYHKEASKAFDQARTRSMRVRRF